jgi:hypothetical protein
MKRRQQEFMTVFVNGKQKRVRRPPMVEGLEAGEFIARNADPIRLHQNEMRELIEAEEPDLDGYSGRICSRTVSKSMRRRST